MLTIGYFRHGYEYGYADPKYNVDREIYDSHDEEGAASQAEAARGTGAPCAGTLARRSLARCAFAAARPSVRAPATTSGIRAAQRLLARTASATALVASAVRSTARTS